MRRDRVRRAGSACAVTTNLARIAVTIHLQRQETVDRGGIIKFQILQKQLQQVLN